MQEKYNFNKIEAKWQKVWEKQKPNQAKDFDKRPKFYCLDMFPYPSGAGLHVGHPKGYTATDIISRYKRMKGFNVLHPIGWDAFGLPAENYAIKTKVHPNESTHQNIKRFTKQIKSIGLSYDWQREIDTSDPEYYKWTQWFFLFLYKQGLAYKAKAAVNWCSKCQTVLANEQAQGGVCERCSSAVEQKDLEQWFFKITDFSEDLLNGLDKIDWPEPIKTMQRNWIGKSEGALIKFPLKEKGFIEVFTTRIDTIFSGTFLILSPEHPFLEQNKAKIENLEEVLAFQEKSRKLSEIDKENETRDIEAVPLKGFSALNPATNEEMPIWLADFVLAKYGTGAVFADAHDKRDFQMAKRYGLPLKTSILPDNQELAQQVKELEVCYEGEGRLFNSSQFDGLSSKEARPKIIKWLGDKGLAEPKVNYKLRDWLVSRQRYWGSPIPIVYCEKCGQVPVAEKDLPVLLPDDVDFMPTGESPLKKSKKFHHVKCPKCGERARRESDTMDTFVCSSWYFFRYTDPKNKKEFAQRKLMDYWLPVDLYVGGAEHAVLHLLYARFFTKALYKAGLIGFDEPFLKLRNVGLILASGSVKMSKSKGNVINPDDIIKEYGADTLRVYEMFMGPFEQAISWDTESIKGAYRFLERIYGLKIKDSQDPNLKKLLHKTIKKVSEDIESMKFNTAISSLMVMLNEMEKGVSSDIFKTFLILLSPFAPHLAEELWQGNIFEEKWPEYDPKLVKDDKINLIVQINGKMRATLEIEADILEEETRALALKDEKVRKWINNTPIKKVVFVKNKLINFVI